MCCWAFPNTLSAVTLESGSTATIFLILDRRYTHVSDRRQLYNGMLYNYGAFTCKIVVECSLCELWVCNWNCWKRWKLSTVVMVRRMDECLFFHCPNYWNCSFSPKASKLHINTHGSMEETIKVSNTFFQIATFRKKVIFNELIDWVIEYVFLCHIIT